MTQQRADALIASVYLVWGMSYIFMKVGLDGLGPFNLILLRFGIAFLVMAALFRRHIVPLNRETFLYSAVLGFIVFLLFTLIMYGLRTTTASAAGFLASTTVMFVPILQAVISRKAPRGGVMAGAAAAMAGTALLTLGEGGGLELSGGAVLCVLSALCYAVHILVAGHATKRVDGLALGVWQLGFAAAFGLIGCLPFETPTLPATGGQWGAVLGLALVCSAYGFVVQPVAQRYTTPERTGLLYALEPVFSASFGFVVLGEVLSLSGYAGAALVLSSVFISNLGSARRRREPTPVSSAGISGRHPARTVVPDGDGAAPATGQDRVPPLDFGRERSHPVAPLSGEAVSR
ncbi:MAG: DMT family transporter [Planctomycetes bacterium]|nr:DMT family transporter [Planctomycetota bacterium]